ncbi:MAG: IPT/TIG domain-containing protein [Parachlamydiaceae bacterium]|nr:IPT/TIG domain-containing protein [Parachlamydiaceae bacterium]
MFFSLKYLPTSILKIVFFAFLLNCHFVLANWEIKDLSTLDPFISNASLTLGHNNNATILSNGKEVFKQEGENNNTNWTGPSNINHNLSFSNLNPAIFTDNSNQLTAIVVNSEGKIAAIKQNFDDTIWKKPIVINKVLTLSQFDPQTKFNSSSSGNIVGILPDHSIYALTPDSDEWKEIQIAQNDRKVEFISPSIGIQENQAIIAWPTLNGQSFVLNTRRYNFTNSIETINTKPYPNGTTQLRQLKVVIDANGNSTLVTTVFAQGYKTYISTLKTDQKEWSDFVQISNNDSFSSDIAINRNGEIMVMWKQGVNKIMAANITDGKLIQESKSIVFSGVNVFFGNGKDTLSINTHGDAVVIIQDSFTNPINFRLIVCYKEALKKEWKNKILQENSQNFPFSTIILNDLQKVVALWNRQGNSFPPFFAATNLHLFQEEKLPTTDSIFPDSGPSQGGTEVIITGSNFKNTIAVDFGSRPALSFHIDSDTQISAITPIGTGTVQVSITTKSGMAPLNATFTYDPSPFVKGLTPSRGSKKGGNEVIIEGVFFNQTSKVTFGNKKALSFRVNSDNNITAVAPPGHGMVNVFVTTPLGTSPANTPADQYTYGNNQPSSMNFIGKTVKNIFATQTVKLNHLTWRPSTDPNVAYYQVLRNGVNVAKVPLKGPFEYNDNKIKGKVAYELITVDSEGNKSVPLEVILIN